MENRSTQLPNSCSLYFACTCDVTKCYCLATESVLCWLCKISDHQTFVSCSCLRVRQRNSEVGNKLGPPPAAFLPFSLDHVKYFFNIANFGLGRSLVAKVGWKVFEARFLKSEESCVKDGSRPLCKFFSGGGAILLKRQQPCQTCSWSERPKNWLTVIALINRSPKGGGA